MFSSGSVSVGRSVVISSGVSSTVGLLVEESLISSGLRGSGPTSSTFGDVCVIFTGSLNMARGWLASLNPALVIGAGSYLADSDSFSAWPSAFN